VLLLGRSGLHCWGLSPLSCHLFKQHVEVGAAAAGYLQPVLAVAQETLGRIAATSAAVVAACGGIAQDVEGVVAADGRVWVVQTRPQV
jgi:hypothetical protein